MRYYELKEVEDDQMKKIYEKVEECMKIHLLNKK